jgi:hypothetical protein
VSSPLARHLTLGCSTGFMDEHRNDWVRLVNESAARSSIAVELSAVSADELLGLLDYLHGAPRLPFLFINVHAPSKGLSDDEAQLVDELYRIPPWVDVRGNIGGTTRPPDSSKPAKWASQIAHISRQRRTGHPGLLSQQRP